MRRKYYTWHPLGSAERLCYPTSTKEQHPISIEEVSNLGLKVKSARYVHINGSHREGDNRKPSYLFQTLKHVIMDIVDHDNQYMHVLPQSAKSAQPHTYPVTLQPIDEYNF